MGVAGFETRVYIRVGARSGFSQNVILEMDPESVLYVDSFCLLRPTAWRSTKSKIINSVFERSK